MVHSCSFIQWGAKGGSIQSGNWHWFADAHRAYEVGSYSSEVDINSKIYAYNSICNTGTYPKCVPVRGGVGGIRCGDRANYQLCIGIGHFTSRGPSVQWKVETQAPSSKLLPAHILVALHSIPRCRLHENISSTMVQAYQCCQNRTSSVPPIQQRKVEDKRLDGFHGKTCRKLWHFHIFPPSKVPQWWKWLPISWPCTKSVWPSKHVSSAKRRYSRIKPPSATLSCKFRLVWPLVADSWQIEIVRLKIFGSLGCWRIFQAVVQGVPHRTKGPFVTGCCVFDHWKLKPIIQPSSEFTQHRIWWYLWGLSPSIIHAKPTQSNHSPVGLLQQTKKTYPLVN